MVSSLRLFSQDRSKDKKIKVFDEQDVLLLPMHDIPLIPKVGDRVEEAQLLMTDNKDHFVYSPVSGVISEIQIHNQIKYVVLKRDPYIAPKKYSFYDPSKNTVDELLEFVRRAGIIGMGGEGVSTYQKLRDAIGVTHTLVLNALESEPFLSADTKVLSTYAKEIIQALRQIKNITQVERIIIMMVKNRQLRQTLEQYIYNDSVQIIECEDRYPLSYEKLIIQHLSGLKLKRNVNALEHGFLIYNVMTCYAIYEALYRHKPLVERVITVDGAYCLTHGNFHVKLGTPLSSFMRPFATENAYVMFANGPMQGMLLDKTKSVSPDIRGIFIFEGVAEPVDQEDCIQCGDCLTVCPMQLNPVQLLDYVTHGEDNLTIAHGIRECIFCNNCSYVCPSYIPIGKKLKEWSQKTQ